MHVIPFGAFCAFVRNTKFALFPGPSALFHGRQIEGVLIYLKNLIKNTEVRDFLGVMRRRTHQAREEAATPPSFRSWCMGCCGSKEEMTEPSQTASPLQGAENAAANPVPANYRNKNRMSATRLVTGGKEASEAAVMNRLNTRRGGQYTKGTMFGVSHDNNLVRDRKNAGNRVYSASGCVLPMLCLDSPRFHIEPSAWDKHLTSRQHMSSSQAPYSSDGCLKCTVLTMVWKGQSIYCHVGGGKCDS